MPFDLHQLLADLEHMAFEAAELGIRPMTLTREYAELSLRLGVMAARIDDFFGTTTLSSTLRKQSWDFTPEMLGALEDGALRLGVPKTIIDEARTLGDRLVADPMIRHHIDKKPPEGGLVQ